MAVTAIRVRLTPRAGKNEISRREGHVWHIRVAAAPVDGAANEALIELLADVLGVGKARVTIKSGHASREKLVQIEGLDAGDAVARLDRDLSKRQHR